MRKLDIEGFEVVTNSDLTEGRGHQIHVCFTSNEALAKEIAQGKGVMGTPATVKPVNKMIRVFDTMEEWNNSLAENVRERALKKLSTEEKIALGLK